MSITNRSTSIQSQLETVFQERDESQSIILLNESDEDNSNRNQAGKSSPMEIPRIVNHALKKATESRQVRAPLRSSGINRERPQINIKSLGPPSRYAKSRLHATINANQTQNSTVREISGNDMSTVYSRLEPPDADKTLNQSSPSRNVENRENEYQITESSSRYYHLQYTLQLLKLKSFF